VSVGAPARYKRRNSPDPSRYRSEILPIADDHDTYTREQLLAAIDTYRSLFAALRGCEDLRCSLCASCVDVVFRQARPAPHKIPAKYTGGRWRR
jgi:hypothetical protein